MHQAEKVFLRLFSQEAILPYLVNILCLHDDIAIIHFSNSYMFNIVTHNSVFILFINVCIEIPLLLMHAF